MMEWAISPNKNARLTFNIRSVPEASKPKARLMSGRNPNDRITKMGMVNAVSIRTDLEITLVNSLHCCLTANSDNVGNNAVPMAVPSKVSGTCMIIQPYVKADTAPVDNPEAKLSRAIKMS